MTRLLGVLPFVSGCLIPYAYPTLEYNPRYRVKAPADEVRAFRVDVASTAGAAIGVFARPTFTLDPMRVGEDSTLPLKGGVGGAAGVLMFAGWPATLNAERYSLRKLYRPGYQTVVIAPWDGPLTDMWTPAADPDARIQAVRDLLYADRYQAAPPIGQGEGDVPPVWKKVSYVRRLDPTLRPGSASIGHRETLLFAADECDRLATQLPADDPRRELLAKESAGLRELAAK